MTTVNSSFPAASFNGVVLSIVSGNGTFGSPSVDNSSTLVPNDVFGNATTLYVNLAGVSFASGEKAVINLCGKP